MAYSANDINRYLEGNLSAAELAAFEQAVNTDPELAAAVAEARLAREVIRSLDRDYWKQQLVQQAEAEAAETERLLERAVIDELDRRHWRNELSVIAARVDDAQLTEAVVTELDRRHWRNELPEIAARADETQLTDAVAEELDRRHWKAHLRTLDAATSDLQVADTGQAKVRRLDRGRGGARRILQFASAIAAIGLLVFFAVTALQDDPSGPLALTSQDYNTVNFRDTPGTGAVAIENLTGTWEADVSQSGFRGIQVMLSFRPDNTFTLRAAPVGDDGLTTPDEMLGGGTWEVRGEQLRLNLDRDGLRRGDTADPYRAAALELWLKNARLFTEAVAVTELTEDTLLLRYGVDEGLRWSKGGDFIN